MNIKIKCICYYCKTTEIISVDDSEIIYINKYFAVKAVDYYQSIYVCKKCNIVRKIIK